MDVTPRHRRALSTALAIFLAIESVSAVAAAAQTHVALRGTAAASPVVSVPTAPAMGTVPAASTATEGAGIPDFGLSPEPATPAAPGATTGSPLDATPAPARPRDPRPAAPAIARPSAPGKGPAASGSRTFTGRNHLWIPALGINRSVSSFPCDRAQPPGNLVYRWGCSGANNVYLLGHAYSVFKPLHDAYVSHRLRVGMKAYFADAKGRVRVYAVRWWKVTLPTPESKWAWAPQTRPSMTLQTCVGRNSEYRLMVRLTEVVG